jgi:hypothetical protein
VSGFQNQPESDRDWLAFRYIAGELSDEDFASFEFELETSQLAREAVARAIELSQAIAIAESQQVELVESATRKSGQKPWAYGICGICAGAAAASVAGAIWWNMPSPKNVTPEVAKTWVEMRPAETPVVGVKSAEAIFIPEPAAAAPSWMTAGVISLNGGKLEDDGDGDGKPDEAWDDEVMEN